MLILEHKSLQLSFVTPSQIISNCTILYVITGFKKPQDFILNKKLPLSKDGTEAQETLPLGHFHKSIFSKGKVQVKDQ